MKSISATDAKQKLAALLDAAQREPVIIRRQSRDVAVVMSVREYDRIRGANDGEFERPCRTWRTSTWRSLFLMRKITR
jgi:prevent-host-death family protein